MKEKIAIIIAIFIIIVSIFFYNLIENNDDFAPYECKEYDKDYNLCTDVYDLLEIKSELTDIAQEYEKGLKLTFIQYDIKENKLNINLSWDILNGATNYDIYIKNELSDSSKYELYKSITQEDFLEKSNTFISFDIDKDTKEIAYDIYVVGRNEEGTSKPSNIESIRDTIEKEEKKEEEKIEKP